MTASSKAITPTRISTRVLPFIAGCTSVVRRLAETRYCDTTAADEPFELVSVTVTGGIVPEPDTVNGMVSVN